MRAARRRRLNDIRFENVERALTEPDTALRLFGKPEVRGHRRMGVSLALGGDDRRSAREGASDDRRLRSGVRLGAG